MSFGAVPGGLLAPPSPQFQLEVGCSAGLFYAEASEFRPRAASLMLLVRLVTPSQHCGAFWKGGGGADFRVRAPAAKGRLRLKLVTKCIQKLHTATRHKLSSP